MNTIRAIIHDRRIEVPAPSELPDGTEVVVTIDPTRAGKEGSAGRKRRFGTLKGSVLSIAPDFDSIPEGFEDYLPWRVLLDTHTLLWSVDEPTKLSPVSFTALQDPANELLLSAATIWELAIKVGQGKIALSMPYRQWMETAVADLDLELLPITIEFAERQIALPLHHKDPFDRLMIAQALIDSIPIVSVDQVLDLYGVTRIWS